MQHEYQGDSYEGISIVGFGVSLKVADGYATVEYNDLTGDFYEVLKSGQLSSRTQSTRLDAEQLAWLENSKAWVKCRLEDQ